MASNLQTLEATYHAATIASRESDAKWREARAKYHEALAATFKWQPGSVFTYHDKQHLVRNLKISFSENITIVASPANKGGKFSVRTTEFYQSTHPNLVAVSVVTPLADASS